MRREVVDSIHCIDPAKIDAKKKACQRLVRLDFSSIHDTHVPADELTKMLNDICKSIESSEGNLAFTVVCDEEYVGKQSIKRLSMSVGVDSSGDNE